MKYLPLLLLIPVVALAQPPAGHIDPQQIFEQSKKMMLPIMEETLPTMREARSCLQGAEDQAAFEKCAEVMVALDKKMRERMGPATSAKTPPMSNPKDIEWNAETKEKMLKFLDNSITVGTAMSDCLNQSTGMEQMQQCMQAKKAKP
jgi:hypothetical protein